MKTTNLKIRKYLKFRNFIANKELLLIFFIKSTFSTTFLYFSSTNRSAKRHRKDIINSKLEKSMLNTKSTVAVDKCFQVFNSNKVNAIVIKDIRNVKKYLTLTPMCDHSKTCLKITFIRLRLKNN